jgi:acetolactate synthase-1/2/3 large subunit
MTGSKLILKALIDQGVEVIFGYPGGSVLSLYDELFRQIKLRHILVRHEQAAVHAAEGYARSTGKVGVVLVTSGPGATNTVTGLLDALCDSVPIVCLTGQVTTYQIGNDAFQEADITGITRSCTKHNYLIKNADHIARIIHEAFYVARTGRPGPVVVDLPKDILISEGVYIEPGNVKHKSYNPQFKADINTIDNAISLIAGAKKPIFYIGGGVINSGEIASQLLIKFVHMTGFPCTQTLMGLGAFPGSDPFSLGMLGMHGTYEANLAMHGSDVIICVGARFDDRITGRLDAFSPNSKKIHIDIDSSSINKNIIVDIPIIGDVASVLKDMIEIWESRQIHIDNLALEDWWTQIKKWRTKDCLRFIQNNKMIKPQYAIQRLYEKTRELDTYITTEVGQHQMWVAQFYKFETPCRLLTSGGLGTMGYGLPSAVGVQIAHPNSLVIDIAGESSIQMNIQEIATLAQYNLPVKVFIINNQYMGMVRQWQEMLYDKCYSESYFTLLPDFVKLAESFGAIGLRVQTIKELDNVIDLMIAVNSPVIVDCCVDPMENCFPMIPPGSAHNEMIFNF